MSDARRRTPQGYFGDPTTVNPERGRKEMQAYGRAFANVLEAFLQGHYSAPEDAHIKLL